MQVTMSPELYNAVFPLTVLCFVFITNVSIILAGLQWCRVQFVQVTFFQWPKVDQVRNEFSPQLSKLMA
jgi:hypothetical protein